MFEFTSSPSWFWSGGEIFGLIASTFGLILVVEVGGQSVGVVTGIRHYRSITVVANSSFILHLFFTRLLLLLLRDKRQLF